MYDELIERLRADEISLDELTIILEKAADTIEGLSHAVDQMTEWRKKQWIPVSERLPEESGDYLVYSIGGTWNQVSKIEIMFCDGERFFTSSFYCPIYWMPLPEPPKDGEA